MKCPKCSKKMTEKKGITPEGVEYTYSKCTGCGEEIVDMKQLNKVAEKYRKMKTYKAKLSKWGQSTGLRIPKELLKQYNLNKNSEVFLIPDKKAIRIIAK